MAIRVEATRQPLLVVELAQRQPLSLGVLGSLANSCATLGDAIAMVLQYFRLQSSNGEWSLTNHHDWHELRCHNSFQGSAGAQLELYNLTQSLQLLRRFIHPNWRPLQLQFRYLNRATQLKLERQLKTPCHKGNFTSIRFESWLLARPLGGENKTLHQQLQHYIEQRLQGKNEQVELTAQVEAMIIHRLPIGRCTAQEIAQRLSLPVHTLRRRLASNGVSFKGILERVQHRLALEQLKDERLSITLIAQRLGYSELSAFSRAFTNKTGQSPRRWRQQQRD